VIVQAVVLYGSLLAAVLAAAATRRHADDPAPSPGRIAWTVFPFAALALQEMLQLRYAGHMSAEWSIPLLAALIVTVGSRDDRVIRTARVLLILVALLTWWHGTLLLRDDYVARDVPPRPGTRLESGWERPLLGYRRVVTLHSARRPMASQPFRH
jgi:hypothetical protein